MKVGHGNANFIADCHDMELSDAEMRKRWAQGFYDKPRSDYAKQWREMAGRK